MLGYGLSYCVTLSLIDWAHAQNDPFINTLKSRQNGHHFADDIFMCIFLNENVWIRIKISLKFVPKSPINNIPALVQIMAWRRPGNKPLFEPMMAILPMHICVIRPQWVQFFYKNHQFRHTGLSLLVTLCQLSNPLMTEILDLLSFHQSQYTWTFALNSSIATVRFWHSYKQQIRTAFY